MEALSYVSLHTAFNLVQLHQVLRSKLGTFAIMAKLIQLGYAAEDVYYQGITGTAPAWFSARIGNQVLVVLDGITTPLQGAALFASLSFPMDGQDGWIANPVAYDDSVPIGSTLRKLYGGNTYSLFLSGYSYGGSLAQLLAAIHVGSDAFKSSEVVTFGSPRPGGSTLANVLNGVSVRRWMCDNDPIPHFPPHGDEAPIALSQLPFVVSYNASLYTQPNGGVAIYSDGHTIGVNVSPSFPPITDLDLLGWVTGFSGVKARSHSLDEYLSRLSSVIAVSLPADIVKADPSGVGGVKPLSIEDYNALALVAGAFLLSPLKGEAGMAYVPVQFRVTIARVDVDKWNVMWMGKVIGSTIFKSQAKTTAKYLNKWLRVVLADCDVSVSGLAAAFTAYWAVAVLGGNGFSNPQLTE